MIESMKVSIIIPVYNVAKYIERCLLSVLNQTWPDLEVILVNDCTPDNSMEIVRRVVASHPRGAVVRCLEHEENRGLSAARNTGISASVGDYLYFLDSDDYISANAIELLADAAVQKRPDFVIGNYEVTGARRWAPPLWHLSVKYTDRNLKRRITPGTYQIQLLPVNLHIIIVGTAPCNNRKCIAVLNPNRRRRLHRRPA